MARAVLIPHGSDGPENQDLIRKLYPIGSTIFTGVAFQAKTKFS